MSGLAPRDHRDDIADLRRRLEILERRQRPAVAPAAPSGSLTPLRLLGEVALSMGSETLYHMLEFPPLNTAVDYIEWGDTVTAVLTSGPYTIAANGIFMPILFVPSHVASIGSTVGFIATILVWNAAVTQRLRAVYSSISVSSGWSPNSSSTSPTTNMAIGSDLSIDSNKRIKTTAGGVFFASVQFVFAVTPPPELVEM